jgi:small subunit ribosomal protein S8
MDHISNLIIKIKNASTQGHETVSVPFTNLNAAILEVLAKEGYVAAVAKKGKKVAKTLEVTLSYNESKEPRVSGVERVSKFSKRIYYPASALRSIRNGMGMMVLTTPSGILTEREARKANVGGEALFKIW